MLLHKEIKTILIDRYNLFGAPAPRSVTLDFLKVSDLWSMTLKWLIWRAKMELKVTHKLIKVTIYGCKITKYSVLNYSYRIIAYFNEIIRTRRPSLT